MNNLKFSDLPQYQKDLKYFTAKLSTITNPSLKTECNNLITHYGKEYIIPKPFDPRLIEVVPKAIFDAAISSGA